MMNIEPSYSQTFFMGITMWYWGDLTRDPKFSARQSVPCFGAQGMAVPKRAASKDAAPRAESPCAPNDGDEWRRSTSDFGLKSSGMSSIRDCCDILAIRRPSGAEEVGSVSTGGCTTGSFPQSLPGSRNTIRNPILKVSGLKSALHSTTMPVPFS